MCRDLYLIKKILKAKRHFACATIFDLYDRYHKNICFINILTFMAYCKIKRP